MLTTKSLFWRIVLVSTLIFLIVSSVVNPPQVQAQSATERIELLISSQERTLGQAPGRTRGGATRGVCFSTGVDEPVIVLGPDNNVGSTVKAFPTFLFYVPYTQSMGIKRAKFMLLDEQENAVLKEPIFVELGETPGIFSLTLPSQESIWMNGKSLEVGKRYEWYFSIICNSDKPDSNVNIHGWLERVELSPDLEEQLQKEPQEKFYKAYQENNIWYEAIAQLAQNRDIYPEDWATLLKQYGLSEFARKPIIELHPLN